MPGSLPNDPIISTPTYTSPVGATAKQAGLGVMSGPVNGVIFNSGGFCAASFGVGLGLVKNPCTPINRIRVDARLIVNLNIVFAVV